MQPTEQILTHTKILPNLLAHSSFRNDSPYLLLSPTNIADIGDAGTLSTHTYSQLPIYLARLTLHLTIDVCHTTDVASSRAGNSHTIWEDAGAHDFLWNSRLSDRSLHSVALWDSKYVAMSWLLFSLCICSCEI